MSIDHQSYSAPPGLATECAVCPHPSAFHDRIAARFCAATVAAKFSRGCVCTAYPDGTGHPNPDKDTS
ncbi:MAG TPA: RGCVC family protein [Actinophytocola sp.]|uniref:RGCVC family protein n=1 Tax=Actinophytocola sp. TaxID=1872138 RepID=UPI002DFD41CC|nr:RGCVC family protein [Actinophytocola sp.]